jgi:hypothetical protein
MTGKPKDLDIMQEINDAMAQTYAGDSSPASTDEAAPLYENAAAYSEATGKRFRMTKAEIAEHGSSEDGRQAAFLARQEAGNLPS